MNDQEPSTVKVQEKSTGNDIVEVNAAYKTYYKKVVYYKRVYSNGKYRYVKAYRYVKSYKYVKAASQTSTKTYSTSKYRKTYYKKVVYYKRVYSKGKYRYVKAYRYVKSYKYIKETYTYCGVATVASDSQEAIILRGATRYRYSGAAHDGATMEKIGAGDCWAMSDYLQTKFSKAGVKSRIVQYANGYSSRHRSVQLYQNNKWLDVPYKQYGINQMFSAQSSKPGMTVITG
ncbi:MAG: hypothetical protein ABFC91_02125 [Methanobacteriaceae archaeon]